MKRKVKIENLEKDSTNATTSFLSGSNYVINMCTRDRFPNCMCSPFYEA